MVSNNKTFKNSALSVDSLRSNYYKTAVNDTLFLAANQTLVTTTVGLATTYTGLVLSNPITSTVNLVLNKISMMQSVLQATQVESFALAVGFNAGTNVTHTTPVVVQNALVNAVTSAPTPTGVGLVDSAATLPTAPVYAHFIGNTGSATSNMGPVEKDISGAIVLAPGAYCAFVTPAQASVAGMWFSFSWEEVAV